MARRSGGRGHRSPTPKRPEPASRRPRDGVEVNGYSERWLRQGFPWVYDNEITARADSLQPGDVVPIRARDGQVLGTGVWDQGKVAVRRFRRDEGPIDAPWMHERVAEARARRSLHSETTAWRWIHGENDDLPGIRVDVYAPDLVITLDSRSLEGLVEPLVEVLTGSGEVRSVWLAWRLQHDGEGPPEATPPRLVFGPDLTGQDTVVQERGLRVGVRPWDGPDVGVYCDMRAVRAFLEPHWQARRVLNLFAYTGMFSVAAAAKGASEVHTVDLSGAYLDRARDNFRLNGIDPEAHVFDQSDSFKALDVRRRKGEWFDVVVADPPAYSHSEVGRWSIANDLPRLVSSCLRVLAPGGWLVLASNLGTQSPKDFQHAVQRGATKVGRSLRIVHEGSTPIDFPAALDFPESRYLKCWVLQG